MKLHKTFSSSPSATVLSCRPRAYKNDVYLFPKELVEKVAKLYLPTLNMELTVLTQSQVDFTVVMVEAHSRVNTTVFKLSYASLICSVLIQQFLTEVVGTCFQPDIFGNPFKSEHYSF